ncbi:MAG: 6-phosphogluconolactonase [Spirochaetaceae bacterium]
MVNWITGTSDSVPRQVARLMARRLRAATDERATAVLAVPGGRSVQRVLEALRAEDMEVPWDRVHVFFVDERCVEPGSPDSNYQALREAFIDPLTAGGRLPGGNVHLPQEAGEGLCDPASYSRALEEVAADSGRGRFDVVLLGVGEDGHVASLFPDHPALGETGHRYLLVEDAPKEPPRRITASRSLIASASTAVALFLGESKREALQRFRALSPDAARAAVPELPCSLIHAADDAWAATDLA